MSWKKSFLGLMGACGFGLIGSALWDIHQDDQLQSGKKALLVEKDFEIAGKVLQASAQVIRIGDSYQATLKYGGYAQEEKVEKLRGKCDLKEITDELLADRVLARIFRNVRDMNLSPELVSMIVSSEMALDFYAAALVVCGGDSHTALPSVGVYARIIDPSQLIDLTPARRL